MRIYVGMTIGFMITSTYKLGVTKPTPYPIDITGVSVTSTIAGQNSKNDETFPQKQNG